MKKRSITITEDDDFLYKVEQFLEDSKGNRCKVKELLMSREVVRDMNLFAFTQMISIFNNYDEGI